MIRFTTEVFIERSAEAVFAYISNPSNLAEWQGTAEVEQLTPGPVGEGTRFREVRALAGRRSEQITEVTDFAPPLTFGVAVLEGPLRVEGHWNLAESEGGTLLRLEAEGSAPRVLRFADPLLARLLKARFTTNHRKLKRALEAGAG